MSGSFRAVIWDFGGVFTSSPLAAFAEFERKRGLPAGFIRKVNATNFDDNAWARFERGETDYPAFAAAYAAESRALGHELEAGEVLALLGGAPRPAMVEALRRVHARLRTGCISNTLPAGAMRAISSAFRDEVIALFDVVIESAQCGIRKPDPRIYARMVEAIGVEAAACVFLDDLGVNLKPARAMGMATIKVDDAAEAIAELERLVGFPLR